MYKCKECDRVFEKSQSMAAHMTWHLPHQDKIQQKRMDAKNSKHTYRNDLRKCPSCSKVFNVRVLIGSTSVKYNKRFCSLYCARICTHTGKPRVIKKCVVCGNNLNKHSAKYCSKTCMVESYANRTENKRRIYIDRWLRGLETGNYNQCLHPYVRKYMIDLYGGKCSKCGWNEIHPVTGNIVLIVHHKDGDYRNSQKDNLDVLCPNHHSLTENYGSLNNGRGRDYRYLRKNAPVV